ncbi:MAG: aspartate ammonia-lyase, partial [Chloroflexi bacterium]|nr:aspartate ammonia-lyase [Chloroflexota bacterium]
LKAAEVSKEAMARNVPIKQVVLEKGYLSAAEIDRVLDVKKMTEGGIMGTGGG